MTPSTNDGVWTIKRSYDHHILKKRKHAARHAQTSLWVGYRRRLNHSRKHFSCRGEFRGDGTPGGFLIVHSPSLWSIEDKVERRVAKLLQRRFGDGIIGHFSEQDSRLEAYLKMVLYLMSIGVISMMRSKKICRKRLL